MINARDELLDILNGTAPLAVEIERGDATYRYVKGSPTCGDWSAFLDSLNWKYDAVYGCQEVYGTIWLDDDTWYDRGEYDGSEWWEHRSRPPLPESLEAEDGQTFSRLFTLTDGRLVRFDSEDKGVNDETVREMLKAAGLNTRRHLPFVEIGVDLYLTATPYDNSRGWCLVLETHDGCKSYEAPFCSGPTPEDISALRDLVVLAQSERVNIKRGQNAAYTSALNAFEKAAADLVRFW